MKKIFVKGKVYIYFTDGKGAIVFYEKRTAIFINPNKVKCVLSEVEDLEMQYDHSY